MSIKNKKIILPILLILIVLITAALLKREGDDANMSVKVLDYGYSNCTMDFPSSSCGPYEVTVQSSDGQKTTYTVAGYGNRDSELYDEITSKLAKAKEYNSAVKLQTNNMGQIISIH